MRLRTVFVTVGVCVLTSGCQLTWDMTRNLAFQACLNTDTALSKIEYCHLANQAYLEYSSHHPEPASSPDFAKGFKTGYADYLEYGGSTTPPPVPPFKYWKCRYQSKEGRQATGLWNVGYKEGASTAKASGARDYIVVPYNNIAPQSPQGGPVPGAPLPGAAPGVLPPGSIPVLPPGAVPGELPQPRPALKESTPLPPPPADKGGAGQVEGPQADLGPTGAGQAEGPRANLESSTAGQAEEIPNAELIPTEKQQEPASLSSPRPLPPQER